jgi:hypothetical protein
MTAEPPSEAGSNHDNRTWPDALFGVAVNEPGADATVMGGDVVEVVDVDVVSGTDVVEVDVVSGTDVVVDVVSGTDVVVVVVVVDVSIVVVVEEVSEATSAATTASATTSVLGSGAVVAEATGIAAASEAVTAAARRTVRWVRFMDVSLRESMRRWHNHETERLPAGREVVARLGRMHPRIAQPAPMRRLFASGQRH